jgi:chromosome segregation ATPase
MSFDALSHLAELTRKQVIAVGILCATAIAVSASVSSIVTNLFVQNKMDGYELKLSVLRSEKEKIDSEKNDLQRTYAALQSRSESDEHVSELKKLREQISGLLVTIESKNKEISMIQEKATSITADLTSEKKRIQEIAKKTQEELSDRDIKITTLKAKSIEMEKKFVELKDNSEKDIFESLKNLDDRDKTIDEMRQKITSQQEIIDTLKVQKAQPDIQNLPKIIPDEESVASTNPRAIRCVSKQLSKLGFYKGEAVDTVTENLFSAAEKYRAYMTENNPGWRKPELDEYTSELWCDKVADAFPNVAIFFKEYQKGIQ